MALRTLATVEDKIPLGLEGICYTINCLLK